MYANHSKIIENTYLAKEEDIYEKNVNILQLLTLLI